MAYKIPETATAPSKVTTIPLVEEIVNSYKNETEYESIKNKLFGYLSQTGVVSGEYVFVDAFKNKKGALSSLKATSTGDFLQFINEYEKYLDKQIIIYHKMADDDIDSRKREFGE